MKRHRDKEWELSIGPDTVRLLIDKAKALSAAVNEDYVDGGEHEVEFDGDGHDSHHHAGLAEEAATRQRYGVQFQEARAARSEIARLNLQAPFAGQWLDLNPDWRGGQWIGTREPLGVLIDPHSWQVDAYVGPDEIQRLGEGSAVRFYPEGVPRAITGKVLQIGTTRIGQLGQPALASRHGGPLAVQPHGDQLVPSSPLFHVLVQLDEAPPNLHETRGHLQIEGQRRSLLADGLMHLAAVFMRESGF